jgi:hypothetical protein
MSLGIVDILFVAELLVSGILEARIVLLFVNGAITRFSHPGQPLHYDPSSLFVDYLPGRWIVDRVTARIGASNPGIPFPHGFSAMQLYLAVWVSHPQVSEDDILGIPAGPSIDITGYPGVLRYLDELVNHRLEFCFGPLAHVVTSSVLTIRTNL